MALGSKVAGPEPESQLARAVIGVPGDDRAGRVRRRQGHRARVLLFILPSASLILLFRYYPAVRSIVGSFTRWNGFSAPTFVGVHNYVAFFSSGSFLAQARNIGILFAGGMAIHLVAPFIGAHVIDAVRPFRKLQGVLKYAVVIPMVVPIVVIINVWAFLLNPLSGPVDGLFSAFGLGRVQWFSNPHTALIGILTIGFPWVSGLAFLVFLAGIQGIPGEVVEAAALDGASGWRRLINIEIPLLIPQIRLVMILNAIIEIQNFIPILLLTNGGPGNATLVPGLEMYNSAFASSRYGYGMAIGTLLFFAMLVFTLLILRVVRPRVAQ